jgi:uncharacterized protein with PIN domain
MTDGQKKGFPTIRILFHESFMVFLKKEKSLEMDYPLTRNAPVKDILEAAGVPHTEIGKLTADEKEVGFSYKPLGGEDISVFPVPHPFIVTEPSFLRPEPLLELRFIVDENVVKLGSYLRMLGIDALYCPGVSDGDIAERAEEENRVLLSRDIQLFKRKKIVFGRFVRSILSFDQLREVLEIFGLKGPFRLFSRCLECNIPLVPVSKDAVLHRLEPKTRMYFNEFSRCPACDNILWKGSHHSHILEKLEKSGIIKKN